MLQSSFRSLMNTLSPAYSAGPIQNRLQGYQIPQAYPSVSDLITRVQPMQQADAFLPRKSVNAPSDLEGIIAEASQEYNIDPELLKAVIQQESGFKPGVVSNKGAAGYMQLMPGTAKELGVTDRFDPRQNIFGGAKYLSQQMQKFGSPQLALAAYNAGPGNVQKYGGIPPFKETQNYVRNIMAMWGYK